ncbi:ErmE/ErmH/ErmO/ErmR family 23S rRNA (adenine(2058)-N(6))-methyltransferase [Actinomadura livida]|uniref:23S rRNA (Adenine(2058)-N(6))-methyltransferase Erm(O) n=1 Tax=Actinomadura livida TaxID=79909 RepID=A0A7W7N1M7_9ACTN|nr:MULTISPECIES: ErmE/ErmH/ErmO/ErmR family 23S rRNA (adenine(2058)-N(6))-methyltransferase [Actinomadura]MBB4778115.1 23S rRNA (adenine-N6)-dimethyltransferase [Actinomadura catellatispora]GGU28915.1 23S rRNA (adenine(2058)-N(6))-methyltransferase Erm(O) [Actinomadura livida]
MARTPIDRARRELSQNLLSARAARRFAAHAGGRLVWEVGAGRGAVTAALAPRCRELVAYELDPRHAAALRARFREAGNVRVVAGDFLAARPPAAPFAVVGNVPFARTSDIVGWCLAAPSLTTATLITQWEYARKRTGDYGRWTRRTISTWPAVEWRLLGRVPRTEFRPVPRVDGGVLRLTRRPAPLLPADLLDDYAAMVDAGFGGKGGSLHASLRPYAARRRLDAAFREAALERTALVGEVTPEQWLALARVLL